MPVFPGMERHVVVLSSTKLISVFVKCCVKENAEALVAATKEIGLEVNADKTKYMVMSRDRNAGRGHSVKISFCIRPKYFYT